MELVGRHGCTMQEIRELFCKHSSHVECQKIENGEFDWMFRFAEDEEDPYYYCFKDEGIHIIYHRFLPEDSAKSEYDRNRHGSAADQQGENYGTDNILAYKPG